MIDDSSSFARLGTPRRIWAVAALHGESERLAAIHAAIARDIGPGDRLVYLGNYIGRGGDSAGTIDELLRFRREVIALPGMLAEDVVYLRGAQEEMWQKLLQIQFAPNPGEVLRWMLRQDIDATIAAYGGTAEAALAATRDGAMGMNRWTSRLREAVRARPGHDKLFTVLQRAAFTSDGGLLLVHSGLDASRPLAAQGDSFWWGSAGFDRLEAPYEAFRRIVRGSDPTRNGPTLEGYAISLDAGCGFGGPLLAAQFAADGSFLQLIQA